MTVSFRDVPGSSRLFLDYLENFDGVAEFFNGDFHHLETFQALTGEVQSRKLPLNELVPILREQNQRFGCGTETLANLSRLETGAAAIVTGQQTGLLGGPLYTLYKTLTAIKLAERLEKELSTPFVPVFWVASDDHDFREANHVVILDKNNQPLEISYNDHPSGARVPIYNVKLSQHISEVIQQLDDATHPSDFKSEILHSLRGAYQPNTAFSAAFGKWLMQLCQSFGLILIDASDARLKSLGKGIFEKEIAGHSPSTRAALSTTERLLRNDYHGQVHLHDNLLNLFFVEKERHAVEISGDEFLIRGLDRTFSLQQLLDLLNENPQLFSPNVLLRPIFQDALLPTVAYVAGPAEVAYYAQMKGIYQSFGQPMPIIYPRKSLTLLEAKIQKVLDNYGLKVSDFWKDHDGIVNEIVRAQLPADLEQRVRNAQQCIAKNLQALETVVTEFEPTLHDTVQNVKARMLHQMELLETKILQSQKKRSNVIVQQIQKSANHLYPKNQLQERALNLTPFLFRYGWGFIARVYEELDVGNFDHQIVSI